MTATKPRVSCVPAADVPVRARTKTARGWRVTRTTLRLDGRASAAAIAGRDSSPPYMSLRQLNDGSRNRCEYSLQLTLSAFLQVRPSSRNLAVAPTITHEKLDELPGAERPRNCGATNSQSATTNGRPAHSSE